MWLTLSGHAMIIGPLAWLGGWGLMRYTKELEKSKRFEKFDVIAFFARRRECSGTAARPNVTT